MAKYLDIDGLTYFYNQLRNEFSAVQTDALQNAVTNITDVLTPVTNYLIGVGTNFLIGGLNDSGETITSDKNIRSVILAYMPFIKVPNTGSVKIFYYSTTSASSFVVASAAHPCTPDTVVAIEDKGYPYIKVMFEKHDSSDYTTTELDNIVAGLKFYTFTSIKKSLEIATEALCRDYPVPMVVQGAYTINAAKGYSSTGGFQTDNTACCTYPISVVAGSKYRISIPTGYTMQIFLFDSTATPYSSHYLSSVKIRDTGNILYTSTSAAVAFVFRANDFHNTTSDDVTAIWENGFAVYRNINDYTTSRPTHPTVGMTMFDQTLGKPVWYNGTAWVDATGATVT